MTHNIGDTITLKVNEDIQRNYETPEITEAFVTDTDLEDLEQPYRFRIGNSGPYGSWLMASEYTILGGTASANNDLDIAQVLVDYAADRLTLQEAVTKLKGLNA